MRNEHEDGVYFDMSFDEYLSLQCLTNSGVKQLCTSPMDFWGDKHGLKESYTTNAMSFGTMAHKLLLEGQAAFNAEYVIKPDDVKFNTKAGKEWKANFPEYTNFVKQSDVNKVQIVRNIVEQIPEYKTLLDSGHPEVTLIWTEEIDGFQVKCAARCDKLGEHGIVDLKTFSNDYGFTVPDAIGRAIGNYKYFVQCQWYLRGLKALKSQGFCDNIPEEFAFFFVQSDGIPNIAVRKVEKINEMVPAYMRQGEIYIQKAFQVYAQNMKIHGWDAPWISKSIAPLTDDIIPNYAIDGDV